MCAFIADMQSSPSPACPLLQHSSQECRQHAGPFNTRRHATGSPSLKTTSCLVSGGLHMCSCCSRPRDENSVICEMAAEDSTEPHKVKKQVSTGKDLERRTGRMQRRECNCRDVSGRIARSDAGKAKRENARESSWRLERGRWRYC